MIDSSLNAHKSAESEYVFTLAEITCLGGEMCEIHFVNNIQLLQPLLKLNQMGSDRSKVAVYCSKCLRIYPRGLEAI